jgi:lipopolysaccharide biosynthesis protein
MVLQGNNLLKYLKITKNMTYDDEYGAFSWAKTGGLRCFLERAIAFRKKFDTQTREKNRSPPH